MGSTRDHSLSTPEKPAVPFQPLAVVGMDCRLPGAIGLAGYEQLLFDGRQGFTEMPASRFDRALYFDSRKGQPGKSYTALGGCVDELPLSNAVRELLPDDPAQFDSVHLNFASVAYQAWRQAGLGIRDPQWKRTGVYVGHSGATRLGGCLNFATSVDEGLDFLQDVDGFRKLPSEIRNRIVQEVARKIRSSRPRRDAGRIPRFNAYTAASLPALMLGLEGPRIVCDAACASSLFAMQQAAMAIQQGEIDAAIVGGATTNGVDNLILFSQSQACSESGSRPFDQGANGLISSEGYAALVVMPVATALQHQLPILGVITGLGTASDGRGKSLWAPRAEGQQLAIRRAYSQDRPLQIDYLEAHATSTQLGDATELHAVQSLLEGSRPDSVPLLIGSAKSNLGHTLETAGVAGLIKILLAIRRGELPKSVGYERPNQNFDWQNGSIRVVDRNRPWVPHGPARRSAVSAFGIGGLNAHVSVQEPTKNLKDLAVRQSPPVRERIAIVGRGVVLPGAHQINDFRKLLKSGHSVIGPAPADRWRPGTGISRSPARQPFTSPTNQGGYIRDYVFDAQPYRIPPKQVKQSNPIQMMLLDAVSQAIQERDGGTWKVNRERTGVVVGTIFGGDFGTQLQLGLRLPELSRELAIRLREQGLDQAQIDQILKDYRQQVLAARPALLDETGSFTASTLASRIAKTFDLMGGACAIDVDNASGLAGVRLALDQLRCGHWDVAICGAADRSMDLMKFEQLDLQNRLVRSGQVDEIPEDVKQILPGEGVVVLMLQRLSDALAAGVKILGIIDDVEMTSEPIESPAPEDAALVRQIGYLAGAQSLVRIVKQTVCWEETAPDRNEDCATQQDVVQITSTTEDELTYQVQCSSPASAHRNASLSEVNRAASSKMNGARNRAEASSKPVVTLKTLSTPECVSPVISQVELQRNGHSTGLETSATLQRIFRFEEASAAALISRLEQVLAAHGKIESPLARFGKTQGLRLAVLAESPAQLSTRLAAVVKQLKTGRDVGVFESERAILWQTRNHAVRTAWVFPGQGAQYSGVPAGILSDAAAQQELQRFDKELVRQGLDPLFPRLEAGEIETQDIWWNQIWVLGLGLALSATLKQHADRPDVVLGHSFGEYTALVNAGVISVAQAIRMVKARTNSVTTTVRESGQLISVRGTPSLVDGVLRKAGVDYQVTHYNAPEQTVVATPLHLSNDLRRVLTAANLASMPVSVPVAYHTSRMAQAEELLDRVFANERFLPPTCPLMSATSARYLSEPSDLRQSLVSQMTRPVLYVPAIERLLNDDVALLIEVGPNNVLSRLNQDIGGKQALCLSLDVPGKEFAERLQMIHAAREILGLDAHAEPLSNQPQHREGGRFSDRQMDLGVEGNGASALTPKVSEVEIVDLRHVGQKAREKSHVEPIAVAAPSLNSSAPATQRSSAAVSTPPALATASPAAAATASSNQGPTEAEVRHFLKTVVVDLTGYSPDVVDFEADLEADLGVDSIKKAQVVGEMAEQFSLNVAPSGVKLGDLKTLGEIARLGMEVIASAGTAEVMPTPVAAATAASPVMPTLEPAAAPPEPVRTAPKFSLESIERFLVDLVVDQTGYSPDVVDLDADMEADLGIDSIKQAQLFGEVQQQFELQETSAARPSLSTFTTLRSILNFLASTQAAEPVPSRNGHVEEVAAGGSSGLKKNEIVGQTSFSSAFSSQNSNGVSQVSSSAVPDEDVRAFAPHDELPAEWVALFCPSADGSESLNWESGFQRGQQSRAELRAALRLLHDRQVPLSTTRHFEIEIENDLAGLAAGAGVLPQVVRGAYAHVAAAGAHQGQVPNTKDSMAQDDSVAQTRLTKRLPASVFDLSGHVEPRGTESMRFGLRIVSAPHRAGMPDLPVLSGPGLIIGHNPMAQAIQQRFSELGFPCTIVPETSSLTELDSELDRIWADSITPHLFITTSHDDDAAQKLDASNWQSRRFTALEVPYRVCQRWMQQTIDAGKMDGGSVVLLTRLGGDFGFSGETAVSPEGGLAGLVKAMLIECWMRGYRATPMKVVDVSPDTTPAQAVTGMLKELAVPSYDMEVAYHGSERFTVQPIHRPLFSSTEIQPAPLNGHSQIRPGGTWIVTGGARGITSVVARELAKRHHLKLHLVGTAPVPALSDEIRQAAIQDRLNLRREVMRQANLRNQNGMEAWRNVEKSIEIDATLQLMKSEGITAVYHSCDVSRFDELQATVNRIRALDGRIDGVIHGAGIGQDARFDRKRPDKVDQCLRAKIDGCFNLMDATGQDKLDWFVCFGSISGRFGANGHTDYSLANDSIAKLVDCYRQERPDVRSVTFHWHAWGDIGMATKPETKLALEMINLEFMPAREGLAHFLHELEHGGEEPEVLITDHAYIRKFFPVDRLISESKRPARELRVLPIFDADQRAPAGQALLEVSLDPKRERFLSQHLVQGKPTLPFVVALELMCEAARREHPQQDVVGIRNVSALQAIKWATDDPLTLKVQTEGHGDSVHDTVHCKLTADLIRRDGRLVARDKVYFQGEFQLGQQRRTVKVQRPDVSCLDWEPISYLPPEAPIYHGPDLQCLQKMAFVEGQGFGLISASSTVQLGGGNRPTYGWSIPCAVMDACLYASAVFAARTHQRPSLPVSFEEIRLGRMPDPGEPCLIQIQQESEEASGLRLAFQLIGLNGDLLFDVRGYRIGWLN